jgi:hypothetical protein
MAKRQINPKLSMAEINAKIKHEIRLIELEDPRDKTTSCLYNTANPLDNKLKKLGAVLNKMIDEETKEKIIQNYLIRYIIKGNQVDFNNIIKSNIITVGELDTNIYEYWFEKEVVTHFTGKIPYGYILEKYIAQLMIDMGVLNLWGGGGCGGEITKYVNI